MKDPWHCGNNVGAFAWCISCGCGGINIQHMRHVHRIYLEFFHIFRIVSALHIQWGAQRTQHLVRSKNRVDFDAKLYAIWWESVCVHAIFEKGFSPSHTIFDFDEFLINWNRHVVPRLKQEYSVGNVYLGVRDLKGSMFTDGNPTQENAIHASLLEPFRTGDANIQHPTTNTFHMI